ncbi:hypothetical protein [Pseudoxanthomonas suwonensis]|nr:hypothetical protein [Pseudoxanthomonas suwonensis]
MKPRIGKVSVGELEAVPGSRVPEVEPQVDAEEPQTPERDESGLGSRPGA